jgi:hypothetical protein
VIRRTRPLLSASVAGAVITSLALGTPLLDAVQAEPAAAQNPAINYRERPRYPFDPQRLKRRPNLDGMIANNEWDPLYTITDGAVRGTVYVNWDDDFLYLAAKTDQPANVIFNIDANADGWLRGADNVEIVLGPAADGSAAPSITPRLLDAAGNKDAPVWNDRVIDPRSIQAVQKTVGGAWVVEAAIPRGIGGLTPRAGGTMAVRADFLPAATAAAPTAPYEPHLLVDIALVESRTQGAPGVTPRLVIEDSKVVPGQALKATLELANQSEEPLRVRSIAWQGEGAAADIVNGLREVNINPVGGLKLHKQRYSSVLPGTAVPGFYQLTAVAQLENGRTVSSTASFAVVETFLLAIETEPDPISILGSTDAKIQVNITTSAPGVTRGDVEIEVPAGWNIKGKPKKAFVITREDTTVKAPFFVTLPSGTQAGEYVINATVHFRGQTWKARRTVRVGRSPQAPAADQTP